MPSRVILVPSEKGKLSGVVTICASPEQWQHLSLLNNPVGIGLPENRV